MFFTTSWDDGSVNDLKLADLLARYDIQGTFYIPIRNRERSDTLSPAQIREIGSAFEIGCHTWNHVPLTELTLAEAEKEIMESKIELEEILGKPVKGFCFPQGKYKPEHINLLKQHTFQYARTINMFQFNPSSDFLMDTTLQVYNHERKTYLKHLLKRKKIKKLLKFKSGILKYKKWSDLLKYIMEHSTVMTSKRPTIHLWGHSWEIEEHHLWNQLQNFYSYINNSKKFMKETNADTINRLSSTVCPE